MNKSKRQKFPLKPLIFGSLAAAFEWYDYALFGYFAVLIGTQFFPSQDPINSLLSIFAVFASGFVMRPLGAILFGYMGDRMGRKYALGASLLLMAIPTTAIGFLPTYQTIGFWAPVGLVFIRLLQGLSVGGNYGGSFIFTIENAPKDRQAFAGSLPSLGTLGGLFFGSGAASLMSSIMSEADLVAFGWRIPFLLGSMSALMGLAIRYLIQDDVEAKEHQVEQTPFHQIWHHHLKNLLRSICIILLDGIGIYIVFVFMTTYTTVFLGMPAVSVHKVNTATMALLVGTIPLFGWLADKWGAARILIGACIGFIFCSIPLFMWLNETRSLEALWGIQTVFAVIMGAVYGAVPVTIALMFPHHVRYTATGLAFNISIAIFGGTAPFIVTSLIGKTENLMIPAYALSVVGVISLIAILMKGRNQQHV